MGNYINSQEGNRRDEGRKRKLTEPDDEASARDKVQDEHLNTPKRCRFARE